MSDYHWGGEGKNNEIFLKNFWDIGYTTRKSWPITNLTALKILDRQPLLQKYYVLKRTQILTAPRTDLKWVFHTGSVRTSILPSSFRKNRTSQINLRQFRMLQMRTWANTKTAWCWYSRRKEIGKEEGCECVSAFMWSILKLDSSLASAEHLKLSRDRNISIHHTEHEVYINITWQKKLEKART